MKKLSALETVVINKLQNMEDNEQNMIFMLSFAKELGHKTNSIKKYSFTELKEFLIAETSK